MKHSVIYLTLAASIWFAACGPTAEDFVATYTVQTAEAASPTPSPTLVPTETNAPILTLTPRPTFTFAPLTYSVTITTRLEEEEDLVNYKVTQISLDEEEIYIYVMWENLRIGHTYAYFMELSDGDGNMLRVSSFSVTPDDSPYGIWSAYEINPNIDAPGVWTYKIYMDGELVIEGTLDVLP